MKTRSQQLASTPKTTLATLAAALLLAVFAFTLSNIAPQTAFAEEDTGPDAQEETTVALKTTQLNSLDGVDSEYTLFYDTERWDEAPYTKVLDADIENTVTISETQDPAASINTVQITATKDVDVDMVLVQIANEYLESAVPDGVLAKDTTYQIAVPKDAKIMHVALYTDKSDAKNADKRGADDDTEGNDPDAENSDDTNAESDDPNVDNAETDGPEAEGTETDAAETDEPKARETDTGDDAEVEDPGDDAADDAEEAADAEDPGVPYAATLAETTATTFSLSVGKTDAKTGGALAGAEFQLKDSSGTVVKTWTSTANNAQLVEGLSADKSYVLSETKAPEGYNREKDINIKYDAKSDKVLINQGGSSVTLDKNNSGASILNVKDVTGKSNVQTSVSTTPKTGDQLNLPLIIGILVVVIAVAVVVAIRARKNGKS